MKIRLYKLSLVCRELTEEIIFSNQLNFFYGPISTGKSTVARLIDYIFGGDLVNTAALESELISVILEAQLGNNKVIFERKAQNSAQIQITWKDINEEQYSVLAPAKNPSKEPLIEGKEVYNLSDLIFYLLGTTPIKVRENKYNEESKLVRLGFRQLLWFCYLSQDELDSSFYKLYEPIKQSKSIHALRFIFGQNDEKQYQVEMELSELSALRQSKVESAKQLREFLEKFGYESEKQIIDEIHKLSEESSLAGVQLDRIQREYKSNTHFADDLRKELLFLSEEVGNRRIELLSYQENINEQKHLKAEYTTTKYKLAKAATAVRVLEGVNFESCPCCGIKVNPIKNHNHCSLCGGEHILNNEKAMIAKETAQSDMDERIKDLDYSIKRVAALIGKRQRELDKILEQKSVLDESLNSRLFHYESDYLTRSRAYEQSITRINEKVRNLKKIAELPKSVDNLENEAHRLLILEAHKKAQLDEIRKNKLDIDYLIDVLEVTYLKILREIGVPEVKEGNSVKINKKTWIPSIRYGETEERHKDFKSVGSGGVKTLLNVCFAIALHKVTTEHHLNLPTLLIIDNPMKNIGKDVNVEIFAAFYNYLYNLMQSTLKDTQVIIIDDTYVPPKEKNINVMARELNYENPLISYYRE